MSFRVVSEAPHPWREIDPHALRKFIGILGAEPISAAVEPDHRIVSRDEIDPRFVIAPVAESVQKRRIGRARITGDHRTDLRSFAATPPWAQEPRQCPSYYSYGGTQFV